MNAIVPDTLQGALILSLIDFFLSFVVISFIGVVLAGFPLLNRVGGWVSRPRRVKAEEKKAAEPLPAGDQDIPIEHVAVIAAAVSAILGQHRIVHIEPARHAEEWTSEGRQALHLSHSPPHQPKH
jgi:hypothetical protein